LIDLKSCSITDESLASIAALSAELRSLDLSWCLGLSDAGIKKLLGAAGEGQGQGEGYCYRRRRARNRRVSGRAVGE
jgi:hypothetical protein